MTELKPKVLLVDDDPAMLLLIAKWLGHANYEIRTASDAREEIARIHEDCPDFLITDWDMPGMSGLQLVSWLRQQELPRYVYTLLLTVRCGKSDIVQGFEAGADDFLRKPVDKDELIARMLSGKRVINLEHQLRALSRTDALTGLMNRPTFLAQMEMEWGRSTRLPIPMSCVLIELDNLETIQREQGRKVADDVLKNVAKIIQNNTRVSDGVCRYADGTIAVLLAETNETNSVLWSERIRGQVEGALFHLADGSQLQLSASFGVVERRGDTESYRQLLTQAEQALANGKDAGKNRVVAHSTLHHTKPVASASVTVTFEHLTARRVMSPVVPRLRTTDTVGRVLNFFLRFNLTEAPVVDGSRQFVGMIDKRELMSATLQEHWQELPIQDFIQREVAKFNENSPALEIYGHFCRTNDRSVVILREGRPSGIVYRSSMLAQLSEACSITSSAASNETQVADPVVPVQTC